MSSNIDRALLQLGSPGCFHVLVYLCLGINNLVVVTNHLAMVVFAPQTDHVCSIPEEMSNKTLPGEMSVTPGECVLNQNFSYYGNWTTEEVKCPGQWNYSDDYSIVSQFNLVCDRAYLIYLATTVYFCGVMMGGLVFGSLSDMYGRKPFLLVTLYAQIAIGIWTAFTQRFSIFMFLRFVQGFLMQGLQTSSLVLMMELCPKRYRTVIGSTYEVFWAIGVMWLALVAFILKDWRYIQLVTAVPSVITIGYIWLIPESIRWLVAHEKYAKAYDVLKQAAKFNRVEIPENLLEKAPPQNGDLLLGTDADEHVIQQMEPPVKNHTSLLDMFKTKELRKRSFILFYVWFVVTATYYGISLRLSSFAGNKYLNFFYGGLCELPAYCAAYFIVNRFGRRHPLMLYLFVGGATGVLAGIFSQIFRSPSPLAWLPTFMAVLSRVSMAGCFSILWLYSSELFPTVIRNVSVGACTFWMRVGAMMSPQILLLGDKTYPIMPIIVFGCVCLVGGGLTFLLPETRGTKLPETVADVETASQKKHPRSRKPAQEENGLIPSSIDTKPPEGVSGSQHSIDTQDQQSPAPKQV